MRKHEELILPLHGQTVARPGRVRMEQGCVLGCKNSACQGHSSTSRMIYQHFTVWCTAVHVRFSTATRPTMHPLPLASAREAIPLTVGARNVNTRALC